MMKPEKLSAYLSRCEARDFYLNNAEKLIADENLMGRDMRLRKASEFLWGAATQAIKALAAYCNTYIRSHSEYEPYIQSLAKEKQDKDLLLLFRSIERLHTNFYDQIIKEYEFPEYYEKVKAFIIKLESFSPLKV